MQKHTTSATGSQDQHEKKEHNHDTENRGEHNRENQFDDPQALQAKGHRKHEAHHGPNPNADGHAQNQTGPTDNTEPGGNRPKGPGTHGGRADHK